MSEKISHNNNRKNTTDHRWLTVKDVVDQFGFSIATQQRLRQENTLKYSKIGRVIRYDRSNIDKMLEDHEVGA